MMNNYEECIAACQHCAIECERCLNAMTDKESDNDCPHCCRECIDICLLCAQAMARDSRNAVAICSCVPTFASGAQSSAAPSTTIIDKYAQKPAANELMHADRWPRNKRPR